MNLIIFGSVFAASLIFGSFLIPRLKELKIAGHTIRSDGPSSHIKKKGTPLMGGLIFIATTFLGSVLLSFVYMDFKLLFVGLFLILFGAVGFIDDYVKVVKKGKNGIGMKQKMIMLLTVSILFALIAYFCGYLDGKLVIPFLGFGYYFNIGIFIVPFAVFILLATTNSVNFTDGVDGLAGSVTSIVLLAYIVITSLKADWNYLQIFSIMILAGLAAFLYFNYHPAKIFMGDSGSLALGGALGIVALLTKTSLVIPVIGIVYLAETISVILQIIYFKKTGKKLFRMAPLHHHFELSGFSENRIVVISCIITAAACIFGIYMLGIRPF